MPIAQMNWGRMRYTLDDPRMAEFARALDKIYAEAEAHDGFLWRIPDADVIIQLNALGYDDHISATVSVWETVESLKEYTFKTHHGDFLERTVEWFEKVKGPQLVIWDVDADATPSFAEAFVRLAHLKNHGPTEYAYGWKH